MTGIFEIAYNQGMGDGEIPTTKGMTREEAHQVIDAYFNGVKVKQEREAAEHGYGKRYTRENDILRVSDTLNNSDHGSVASVILDILAGSMFSSDDTFSAVMDVKGTPGEATSSFILETSDMNIIERYRVTVERAD